MFAARTKLVIALLIVLLAAPQRTVGARKGAPRVPMARALQQIVQLACQRVYGTEPSVVAYCVEVYQPYFQEHVAKTPFCPRSGALVERMQACADALVAVLVVGGSARSTAGPSAQEAYLRQACTELQLCGGPFVR